MTLHNNDKDPCTMARKRPSLSNQKAGLDTVTVMNVHFQPDFAKQGHRALMVLIAILLICRSHQCLMMAGDLSAACYRLYNPNCSRNRGESHHCTAQKKLDAGPLFKLAAICSNFQEGPQHSRAWWQGTGQGHCVPVGAKPPWPALGSGMI